MLILGAKGFAKEVLEVLSNLNLLNDICFYDDVNITTPKKIFGQFPVIKTIQEAEVYLKTVDKQFTVGIGNPVLRKKLFNKFSAIGGELTSTISPLASIGTFDVQIGNGTNVLSGAVFSNGSKIGMGSIVYYNSIITHDCVIGDFVEIAPSVTILGRSNIGSFTQLGSNSTILPDIKIGENVIIGAGTVVTKDIPDNCMAIGSPARVIKGLKPIDL